MTSMSAANVSTFTTALLDQSGLNRQAVFALADLPADVAATLQPVLEEMPAATQLILIGHGGRRLWEAMQASGIQAEQPEHPIDAFTCATIQRWFAQEHPGRAYRILYPGPHVIGLQRLGQLAGWHHASPFMVGVDADWGSWFAYRAVVIADTTFAPTPPAQSASPCQHCGAKVCIQHCPGHALDTGVFALSACVAYRKQPESRCKYTCLARVSCPVGSQHRYTEAQLHHTYSRSMKMIEERF